MTSEIRANAIKNRVGLGTVSYTNTGIVVSGIVTANSFSGPLTSNGDITGTGNLTLTSTDAGSSAAPIIDLFRNSASPADADYLGQIKFQGESDTGVQRNYAKITGKILDASNGTEDGIIEFAHIKAGSQNISARFRSDSLQLLNGTALTVAGTSTFNGDITGAAGVDLNLDSTLGNNSSTAYSGFDGRLVFDTSYSDTARGPNKIQLQNASNTWIGGFGISNNALDIYTGGTTAFRRSSGTNTYTTQLTIDYLGNISPSGDVRLTSSAGNGTSTAVTDAAWSRLEFDQDYSDTARGPNKILLTPYSNWKGGFGISSNSLDVYTGGNIHFYGKTNTDDAANIELLAKFATDGAVELYWNNVKKLETSSGGVNISGITTSNSGFQFGSSSHYIYQSASDTATLRVTSDGPYAQFKDVSGDLQMGSASGTLLLSAGGTERLRIASDGDLTHTGSDNVEYKMKCGTSSGNNIIAFLNSGGTTRGNITYDSDNNFLFFNVNQVERLRIDSSGNVLVKSSSSNQQPKLRVESYGEYGEIKADGNGSIIIDADPDFNSNDSYIGFSVDGSMKSTINADGTLQIGNLQTSQNSTTHTSATKLHIDSTKSIKIARLGAGSISSAGWYTVAKIASSNGNYFKCYASIGGDFTQDMCVIELTGSFSASGGLQNTYAEPVFKAYRTGAHSTDRITRARFVKDSSNVTYLQIYIAGGVNSNTFGKSVLEYQIGAYSQNTADSGSAAMFEAQASGLTGIRTLEIDDNAICVSAGSHKFYSGGGATERVFIPSGGGLAVGTASPTRTPLHVHEPTTATANIHLTNSSSGSGATDGLTIFLDNSPGAGLWFREAGPLRFGTDNDERLRITSSGRIRLGGDPAGTTVSDLDVTRGNSTITDVMLVKGNVGNGFIRFQDNDSSCNFTLGADDGAGLGANSFILYDRVNNAYRWSIDNNGNMRVHSGKVMIGASSSGSFTSAGLILDTPVYKEYQYTWQGHNSYTIDLTCGSYFHAEVTYVQHQTNGGMDMQNYARMKWANNHVTHTGYMYEFSGQGTNAAVSTTFTVSDQSGGGSVDVKAGLTAAGAPGASYRGKYGGGNENTSSTANGRLRISETYNGSGLSASTRGLIVRVYFGSFSASIS